MTRTLPFLISILLAVACIGTPARATSQQSIAEKVANQNSLRASIEKSEGKFSRLAINDRVRLLSAQDRALELLDGKASVENLSASETRRLQSAEAEITRIVATLDPPATGPKVVCSYKVRIGSNRKERVCEKVGSSDNSDARKTMRSLQTR